MSKPGFSKRFPATAEKWGAMQAAEQWLEENGYSVGTQQAREPRGILKNDGHKAWDISKWRGLSVDERAALDGTLQPLPDNSATIFLKVAPEQS